jgi:hypothetical protein
MFAKAAVLNFFADKCIPIMHLANGVKVLPLRSIIETALQHQGNG